ncbi:PWWP domain [Macleaya cordata]|uniref:PWWP domain n=1 Tax=Macleaya cordata TaxID=56857 RepID=A0A200R657_MACCD|nr:PWWP domain [Macleaya cordata]
MEANPSNNLDLNSEAVPMDDRNEISGVRLNESSGTISVSVAETLIEGGVNEVRVSSGGENLLEPLVEGSDVRVEGNLNEEAAASVALISLNEGGDEKSFGGLKETEVGDEVVKVERFTESLIGETEVVLDGKTAEVPNEEVLGTREEVLVNDDNLKETRVSSLGTNAGICENTTSRQDEKRDPVVQVAEMVSNKVDGDEKMNFHSGEINMYSGVHVTVDSSSVAEDINETVETVGPLPVENPEEVQETEASGTHLHQDQKKEAHVAEIVTSLEEKIQNVEVVTESKAADGFCKQDENQIMESHAYEIGVSELIGNGPNFGSIVVDLGIYPNTDGDQNTGGEGSNPLAEFSEKAEVEEIRRDFSVSDLVWGKVSSHPWWPGQIFDPLDSSKLAMKHHKRDRKRLLVAYFGDQTFAWNVASSLKPFQSHFSQMEKQTDLEAFRYAIDSALDEISRRVQLGLACSCTPDEAYANIKYQIIKNAGIRAESSRRDGVDKNLSVTAFEPGKLLEYIKALALNPRGGGGGGGGDRLELVVAQAQLVAFYRSKGYLRLPEFCMYGGLLEKEAEHPTPVSKDEDQASSVKRKLKSQDKFSHKRQKISDDNLNPIMKERSLSELMAGEYASGKSSSNYSGKKRKAVGSFSDDLTGEARKQRLSQSSYEDTESQSPRSFKVGESIRRIASQLKGSPSILNSSSGRSRKSALKTAIPKEYSSPDEMLSQLHLAARDPMKGYSFLTIIVGFFTDFRNSISLDLSSSGKRKVPQTKIGGGKAGGRNRKSSDSKANSTETYSYEDMSDSYWTDMIIHSSPEEQSSHKNQKRKGKSKREAPMKMDGNTVELEKNLQSDPTVVSEEYNPTNEPENYFQFNSTLDSKQQHPDGDTSLVTQEPVGSLNKNGAEDISPTALILNFTEADSIPSEMDLNKIFSRFGPLKESETEVLKKTSRARVIFKRRNDAEVAFSSAGKFSIFGPALASYQLRYLPSTPSKASSHPATE